MFKVLPDIVNSESEYDALTKDTADLMLNLISKPIFIARIILLDQVLYPVALLEKTAQATDFGPFDFVKAKEKFIDSLQKAKENSTVKEKITHLIKTGELAYEYFYKKKNPVIFS